jgi:hypothetical protein
MATPKGSISTEGETLQVSVLPYRCTILPPVVTRQMSNFTILANSKALNASLFPVHAMFRHDCPLAVKPADRSWRLVYKQKTWRDYLSIDMLLSAVCLGCWAAEFGNSGGIMNYPVF